ncbi:MAG: nitrilase [Candidatus Hecatellales archaeon B24]|nr:MAG: nitrilase [Candidatus Hecatellales archaeon B24]
MVTVSLAQMDVRQGDVEANRRKALEFIEEAGRRRSNVLVLPELWPVGYILDKLPELAEPLNGETVSMLKEKAVQHDMYIIGSIAEFKEGKIFNTVPLVGPEGLVGVYSKIHLFKPLKEHLYFTPGRKLGIFDVEFGRIGVAVCYDLRFPEVFRVMALKDVSIVFVVAAFPNRLNHWRSMLYSRAVENQFFMVAANRIGSYGDNRFFGHSMVIDPDGEILVEAGETEILLTCDLKLEKVKQARSKLFHVEQRKAEIYDSFLREKQAGD